MGHRHLIGLGLVAVLVVGCGSADVTADDVAGIGPDEAAEVLGGDCDPDVDYGDLLDTVAHTEEWLEIVAIDGSVALDAYGTKGGENEDLAFTVRAVNTVDDVGPNVDRSLVVHTTLVPGIAWGLAHDARVFVGTQSEGLVRATVAFALVEDTEGAWFVPGLCATGGLDRVVSEQPQRIDAVIGMTDPVEAEGTLDGTVTTTGP